MMSTEMVAVVVRSFKFLMSNLLDTQLQHTQSPILQEFEKPIGILNETRFLDHGTLMSTIPFSLSILQASSKVKMITAKR